MWNTFAHYLTYYAMIVLPHVPRAIKYYIRAPTRPRLWVTILGPVKCAYVISGTFACFTTFAEKTSLLIIPVSSTCFEQLLCPSSGALDCVLQPVV